MPDTDETLLFRYSLQGQERAADPFRVERLLAQALGGERLEDVVRQAKTSIPSLCYPALTKLVQVARAAFELPEVAIDGTGVPEKAALRVLREFAAWRRGVRQDPFSGSSPMSAPAMVPSSDGPLPATSCTDSGS